MQPVSRRDRGGLRFNDRICHVREPSRGRQRSATARFERLALGKDPAIQLAKRRILFPADPHASTFIEPMFARTIPSLTYTRLSKIRSQPDLREMLGLGATRAHLDTKLGFPLVGDVGRAGNNELRNLLSRLRRPLHRGVAS